MADIPVKISAFPAATSLLDASEMAFNEAGTTKKVTLQQLRERILKNAVGTTIAAGEHITWLALGANSSDITGTTLTTVMQVTDVGVGRWHFRCLLVYQTTATTTGMQIAVNHSGTTTQFVVERRIQGTGTTASSGAATQLAANAAGGIYEAQGTRTKNAIIGAVTISVDTANADMLATVEGFFVVTATGTLEIKLAAELASLVVRAMQGSHLELMKVG